MVSSLHVPKISVRGPTVHERCPRSAPNVLVTSPEISVACAGMKGSRGPCPSVCHVIGPCYHPSISPLSIPLHIVAHRRNGSDDGLVGKHSSHSFPVDCFPQRHSRGSVILFARLSKFVCLTSSWNPSKAKCELTHATMWTLQCPATFDLRGCSPSVGPASRLSMNNQSETTMVIGQFPCPQYIRRN